MDWKKEAQYQLEHYNETRASIKAMPEEIRALEIQASSLRSSMSDAPRVAGGKKSKVDALMDSIVYREELQHNLDLAMIRIKRIDAALSMLPQEDKQLLEILFVNKSKGCIDRACELMFCDAATVYRRKDRALLRFTKAMYGVLET